ncbi:MAG TPA: hypothetical protein GX513_01160, partial [Firmicutes bacterium]|nr:hypothetical protein [Bacillota bacterium]
MQETERVLKQAQQTLAARKGRRQQVEEQIAARRIELAARQRERELCERGAVLLRLAAE